MACDMFGLELLCEDEEIPWDRVEATFEAKGNTYYIVWPTEEDDDEWEPSED